MLRKFLLFSTLVSLSPAAIAQQTAVTYLANEGVMVWESDTKVLFDPLYDNSYGTYQMVPDRVREAIFAGEAPYDDVEAVFVSHHHGDHFSATDMLRLLRERPDIRFYAPAQAVIAVREIASDDDQSVLDRMTGLDMAYGDAPVRITAGNLTIDAAYVPHAGWPTARTDVQNIAFRVSFGNGTTVLHMGDADARTVHFDADEQFWEETTIDLAMPPFWYFLSEDGIEILEGRLDVIHAIGIHVPDEYSDPSKRPEDLLSYDLFTSPGEGRRF